MHGKGQVKLTSWLGAALCDQPANYPESTRRTHIGRVLEFVHELVNGDEGRERYLVAAAQQKLRRKITTPKEGTVQYTVVISTGWQLHEEVA
jgi:hypothetical protein